LVFAQADAIDKVAAANPDKMFSIIDVNWLDRPNLRQYTFKEEEGSYLVGMAAAMASETGTVGFVGGMDIPLIRAFQCGYEQGVMAVNSSATVLSNMTGTTPAAWNDPAKGSRAYAEPNRPWCGRCISSRWRNRRWSYFSCS
jgi:basic membrane protein A